MFYAQEINGAITIKEFSFTDIFPKARNKIKI